MTEINKGNFTGIDVAYWREEYAKLEALMADTTEALEEMKEYYESAMREPCDNGTSHCDCLPALRKRAEVAEAVVTYLSEKKESMKPVVDAAITLEDSGDQDYPDNLDKLMVATVAYNKSETTDENKN